MKFIGKNEEIKKSIQPSLIVSNTDVLAECTNVGKISISVTDAGLISKSNNGYVAVSTTPLLGANSKVEQVGSPFSIKSVDLENSLNSFEPDDLLVLTLNGNEFKIALNGKEEESISMPIENQDIDLPEEADKFNKTAKINRSIFLNLINRVSFAIGYEELKAKFMYIMVRISKGKARSVCGNDKRFAIFDVEGDNISDVSKDMNILFYTKHNKILEKLAKLDSCESILFQEHSGTGNDVFNHMLVGLDSCKLVLFGHQPTIQWIDENTFLNKKYANKFVTKANDWSNTLKTLKATINKEVKKQTLPHWIKLTTDSSNELNVNTEVYMKANRKVLMTDIQGTVDFKCLSQYLIEAIEGADLDDYIQFEMNGPNDVVLIRHFAAEKISDSNLHSVNMSTGVKESYTFFFAPYNK